MSVSTKALPFLQHHTHASFFLSNSGGAGVRGSRVRRVRHSGQHSRASLRRASLRSRSGDCDRLGAGPRPPHLPFPARR